MGPTTSNVTVQGNAASTTSRAPARPAQQAPKPPSEPAAVELSQTVSATESAESVRQAVEQANEALRRNSVGVEFSLDQGSGRVIVRVVDSETKETLRQIPSEQMLAIAQAMDDLRGLLIKQEA